jgi:hypothetical protein
MANQPTKPYINVDFPRKVSKRSADESKRCGKKKG